MARNDAVRFDLKVEPRRPNDADRFEDTVSGVTGSLSIFNSTKSHSSKSVSSKGWSKGHSSQFEYRGCRFSSGLLWLGGVGGERLEGDARPWSNDGIDSLDVDLTDCGDSCSESLQDRIFSLSGGLRRRSSGEYAVPSRKWSSFDFRSSCIMRLKSSA